MFKTILSERKNNIKPEIWKAIIIDENKTVYEISNHGKCRNTEKLNWKSKGILKPKYNKSNGYYSYGLHLKNKEIKYKYVHRLVAEYFIGFKDGLEVNHKDGNKSNNYVDNLEWCNGQENMQHASKHELIGKPINQYNLEGIFIKRFSSATQAEKELGFKQRTISAILCYGDSNSQSHGYQWRFEDDNSPIYNITNTHKQMNVGVVQLTSEGEFIDYFPKITLAYKKINKIDNGLISQVCKGKMKSFMGYKWKYAKEYYG